MATVESQPDSITGAAPTRKSGLRPYRITVDVYERIAASGVSATSRGYSSGTGNSFRRSPTCRKGGPTSSP